MPKQAPENNLEFWNSISKTDPDRTKAFTKAGGFRGTAIDPMYLIQKATSHFGPIGIHWGFSEKDHIISNNIWFSKVELWYEKKILETGAKGIATIEQWGATPIVSNTRNGERIDEDAAKKSITDGLTKCLSYLGFAADVHMGKFDDTRYVQSLSKEKQQAKQGNPPASAPSPQNRLPAISGVKFAEKIADNGLTYLYTKGNVPADKSGILRQQGFAWSQKSRCFWREAA